MRPPLPILAAAALAGSTLSAAPALAQDDLVTAKSRIIAVKALGDDVLVVSDRPRQSPTASSASSTAVSSARAR